MAAPEIVRLQALTLHARVELFTTFNGIDPAEIARRIECGELALLAADMGDSMAYAIVSREGDVARIEALAGAGGMYLARRIVDAARAHGLKCEAWVLSKALARLTGRIGMRATGERYGEQLRVVA